MFGNAPRNFIMGRGTVQNNMALSKTMQLGETRSLEIRATINNVFNTVQYSGVDTNVASPTFGQVTSAGSMRSFQFTSRFRFLMANWITRLAAAGGDMRACVSGSVQIVPAQDPSGADGQADSRTTMFFKANAELVLTNVVVRDSKTGEFVRGLKQSDFTVLENGKPQQISSFDFQSVDMATPLKEATVSGLAAGLNGPGTKAAVVAKPEDLRNHRLIVMFFDLTSMQPEDLDRCVRRRAIF